MFRQYIPNNQALTTHLIAVGMGLLGIAWMVRRGYISAGALTPALFVIGVAVTEYLQAAHLTPSILVPFALSLSLPGSGLFVLGLVSLATSIRTYLNAKRHPANRTQTPVQRGTTAMYPVKGGDR